MRKLSSALTVAAVAATVPAIAMSAAAPASAATTHRMTLLTSMHTCDFQSVDSALRNFSHPTAPTAEITSDGHTATAHVAMTSGSPNAQYVVRLIPAPHSLLGCQAGDPSIGTATLRTDNFGAGSTTVSYAFAPGTTGMWVAVDLPSTHSQTPVESYSPTFIASI